MRKLSHLAHIVLGVVAEGQPCSAYAVMKDFQASTSSYYSGSAGAIYPLMKRLAADGLIKFERSTAGSRSRKTYSITKKGQDALNEWLSCPTAEDDVAYVVDLLRTRVLFFGRLSPSGRKKFVNDSRKLLEERIKSTESAIKKADGLTPFATMTLQSVVLADKARLDWLEMVEREFC